MSKPQVANLIAKVEKGVDQFRESLKKRGDKAGSASTAQAQGRRAKRGTASESTQADADNTQDEPDDTL